MRLIVDVDGTLTVDEPDVVYAEKKPRKDVILRVNELHSRGITIVIYTARNMRTHEGNLGKINKRTLPPLIDWLQQQGVCYDEIYVGKPWCGSDGFYVDDRSIRPSEFISISTDDLVDRIRSQDPVEEAKLNGV